MEILLDKYLLNFEDLLATSYSNEDITQVNSNEIEKELISILDDLKSRASLSD